MTLQAVCENGMKTKFFLCVFLQVVLALSFFGPVIPGRAAGASQDESPGVRAQTLLTKMTPEERIGQLFLVTFTGSSADEKSTILDLVKQQRIGGVVLLAGNDNFADTPNTISQAYQLISGLQNVEWESSQKLAATPSTTPEAESQVQFNYIPLFIGISQEGDGFPNDQILNGLTPLPDLMAIGAAWQPSLAQQVGNVAGQELSAIGFNLFFGPSLDVLELPGSSAGSGLGASVFGGDPYWVGEMGQAYIAGLHTGSNGRMAVVAKHFPGRGSADRPAGEEVATVRKSLEQLKQIELAPFFAVTGNALALTNAADGLLVSHIRYQGFQGNIRATTRPVSFDPQALTQILSLPAFASWRDGGGLMVSDDLSSTTVRRFYDPSGQSFNARLVVRDAFLAGNDLLYLGNILSSDAPDTYTTIIQILEFFTQKYREDPAFAQRVDAAATRILTLKYRLYGNFTPSNVIPSSDGLDLLGQSMTVTFDVASQSATLISPDLGDLTAFLPPPPGARDHIVFLTDTRPQKQCSTCTEQPMIKVDALQNAILGLYGPNAGGQVFPNWLVSYSFDDLSAILNGGSNNDTLVSDLRQAQWVIICMLDIDPKQPEAVLRRFLSERQDLLRNKNIIVFAFNAPYYLDATDISKLTAYYGLFSKSVKFVDVAARLLFQELSPAGSLPVSVPGIGYDLLSATAPDPNQIISLSLDMPPAISLTTSATPEATPTPNFHVNDTISVRTGMILDHNQRPVPDGTGVRFTLSLGGSGDIIQQVDSSTTQGVAQASFNIDRSGLLEIRAASEPARISVVLQLEVTSEGVSVTALTPTPAEITATPMPKVEITPVSAVPPLAAGYPGVGGWFLMLAVVAIIATIAFWFGRRFLSLRWGLRWALCTVSGGLAVYNYIAFGLPGGVTWLKNFGLLGVGEVVLLGTLAGWGGGWLWSWFVNGVRKRSD